MINMSIASVKSKKPAEKSEPAIENNDIKDKKEKSLVNIKDLSQKAILIQVTIGGFVGNKKDKTVTEEVAKDKNAKSIRVWKSLFSSPEMRAITNSAQKIRSRLYEISAPWGENSRIVKINNYLKVKSELEKLIRDYYIAVGNAINAYDNMLENDKQNLGDMFNPDDYPSKTAFGTSFYARIEVKPVEKNDFRCGVLSDDDIKYINEQIESRTKEAIIDSQKEVLGRVKEQLFHILARLKSDGKIHGSMFTNLTETLENAQSLNITDDAAIETVLSSIKESLSGHDIEAVRENKAVRSAIVDETNAAIEKINDAMSAFGF